MDKTKHTGNISNDYRGYYQESIIRNLSEHPLFIMDELGNEVTIEPDTDPSMRIRNQIVVMLHSRNGSRSGTAGLSPKEFTSYVYKVSEVHTPVHVEDLSIVMTIDRSVDLAAHHPNSRAEYSRVLEGVSRKMETAITTASITFLLNDPLGRFNELYVSIDDTIPFPVPVTHCPGKQEMTLVVRNDGVHENLLAYDISKIANNDYIFIDGAVSVGLGINSAMAKEAHQAMLKRRNDKLNAEVTKRMEVERKSHQKELEAEKKLYDRRVNTLKGDHEHAVNTMSKKIDVLNSKLECVTNERETLRSQLKTSDEWKNLYQARSEDVHTKHKETEQQHKAEKAEVQVKGEIWKQALGVAKYAAPILLTVGGILFARRE